MRACAQGEWRGEESFPAKLMQALMAQGPSVDLVIRTGGEKRLSDFLLWESAYAELVFVDRMWPEFSTADLDAALGEFSRRERRFGAVSPDSVSQADDAEPEPGWGTMTGTGD